MIEKEILIREIEKFQTIKQIADTLNVTHRCVEYWLKKHGLKTKRRQRKVKRSNNKPEAVKYKGGKCEICCIKSDILEIYDFHHKDPSKKELQISNMRGGIFAKIKKELDKCHMLCANCHEETHGGFHPEYLIQNELSKLINNNNNNQHKFCRTCHKTKCINEFYTYKTECKKCFLNRTNARLRKIKMECLKYKGGKCEHCGYNKYIGTIEFHHLDPRKKDFGLSRNQKTFGNSHKKELDKCVALCSNCHRKEHYRLKKLTKEERINEYNKSSIILEIKNYFKLLEPEVIIKKKWIPIRYVLNVKKQNGKYSKFCDKCNKITKRKVTRPPKKQLVDEITKLGYCGTGRKYGVSDNAIRKWLKNY